MLDVGLIWLSQSPFSELIIFVKKKDDNLHCCIDYRAMNTIKIKHRFLIPIIDELLDELGKASWFSKLNLRQEFHQIRMVDEDIPNMDFHTHQGHHEYRVMSFRLYNAPSIFQATMNKLFESFLYIFVAIFFNDILEYSSSFSSHLKHLEAVFTSISQGQFYLRWSKCIFVVIVYTTSTTMCHHKGSHQTQSKSKQS